jgi:N-acetylneuraminate synthase/N,N'-diacetyllegionaminate synthase
MRQVKISYDDIGKEGASCFIIAEVGLNHNGDLGLALKSVEAAAKAGADAVKFQNYRTEDFIFDKTLTYTYFSGGNEITESMWDICKRCEMKKEWLSELKKLCDDLGIALLSTPTSESGVDDLIKVGVTMLKNGSDYLTHLPLLKYMGATGLTVIISTGMADECDIQDAVGAVSSGGDSPIILMHCTSSYPTEPKDVNLNRMLALRERFNMPVGFSDHTIGSTAAVQAVTLGICVLEKHFTLDHNLPGPDHWFSVTPSELMQYINDVREAEQRMGCKNIEPAASERINRNECRLSLIASKDLVAGHIIGRPDFVISKPGTGLPPKEAEKVIGRELAKNVLKGSPLLWEYFK